MGVNYTDDISKKPLDQDMAYQMQFVKFESDKKMIKSKKFYIGLDTIKSAVGDQDLKWETWEKVGDSWQKA
jgi:hypothetical protein